MTNSLNQLSMAQIEEMAAGCDPVDPKAFIMMTAQLLASMQREAKLREALDESNKLLEVITDTDLLPSQRVALLCRQQQVRNRILCQSEYTETK